MSRGRDQKKIRQPERAGQPDRSAVEKLLSVLMPAGGARDGQQQRKK